MSNLWDLSHIRPQPDSVLEGETISAMFWNAAAQRAEDQGQTQRDQRVGPALVQAVEQLLQDRVHAPGPRAAQETT